MPSGLLCFVGLQWDPAPRWEIRTRVCALVLGQVLVGPALHPGLTLDPAAIQLIHTYPPCHSSFQLELLGSLWLSTSNRSEATGNNRACLRRTRAVPMMK